MQNEAIYYHQWIFHMVSNWLAIVYIQSISIFSIPPNHIYVVFFLNSAKNIVE